MKNQSSLNALNERGTRTPDALQQGNMSTRSGFCNAVQEMLATEIKFTINGSGSCAERVVQVIYRKRSVLTVVTEDDGVAIPTGDVNAPSSADGRRENEIVDAFEANGFATWL